MTKEVSGFVAGVSDPFGPLVCSRMLVAFTVMVVLMVLVMLTITMTSVMVYYGALGCLNKGALSVALNSETPISLF